MTALTLTMRAAPPCRLDASHLIPSRLKGLGAREIGSLVLANGSHAVRVGDIFDLTGDDAEDIRFLGDCGLVDYIGARLEGGRITVEGNAGAYTGLGMRDGTITVTGNADAYAGAAMSGGFLSIAGDAGDLLGAPRTGDMAGMRGGVIHVVGRAGNRAGERMRRGVIVISGDAGDRTGAEMIAGTVVVLGRAGSSPGMLMRRGSIVLSGQPAIPPSFLDAGTHDFLWLRVLNRDLAKRGVALGDRLPSRALRYSGDMATLGRGEILVLA